jgi:hypothetical protein
MASNSLKVAITAVLLTAASGAHAIDPAARAAVLPSTVTQFDAGTGRAALNISGATATDRSLLDILLDKTTGVCADVASGQTNTAEVYTTEDNVLGIGGGTFTTQNYTVICTLRTIQGSNPAGSVVSVSKYSGGSGNGINQVATGTLLASDATRGRKWVDVGSCTTATPTADAGNSTRIAADVYLNCPVATLGYFTKRGIADVEPGLLSAVNPFFGVVGGPTAANIANISSANGVGVGFAPVVSVRLFDALRAAQGLNTGACAGLDGAAAGSVPTACVPSLSLAAIRTYFQGGLTSQVGALAVAAGQVNTAAIAGTNSTTDPQMYICRRETSSGTQVSFQSYYLQQGCTSAQRSFVTSGNSGGGQAWSSAGADQTFRVWAGNGASEVKACMNARNANGQFAIGLLSTENPMDVTDSWRYIRIDGVASSLEQTQRGSYMFYTENAIISPSNALNNTLSTQQNDLANAIRTNLRNAAALVASNVQHFQTSGGVSGWTGGLIAIPANAGGAWAPSQAGAATNPANSQTKAITYGGAANNCTPSGQPKTGAGQIWAGGI